MSSQERFNIADRLTQSAARWPDRRGIVFPEGRDSAGRVAYTHLSFSQLEREVNQLADSLIGMGVRPEHKLVLMVKPSIEFIALTFAIFRTGATVVLIDPGMGRRRIFDCLSEVEPDGFVAIPIVHGIRLVKRRSFPKAKLNVCVGRKFPGSGISYNELLERGKDFSDFPSTTATDRAAIIFTSGSTGPPKGVVYEHGMFNAQVDRLQEQYGIEPGETDLPGFPLFALFNLAMGVTTVIPDMDPTRPADVDPKRILEAIENHHITQAYGSPALWNRVGRYCHEHHLKIPYVKRILSAGAPVPVPVLKLMQATASTNTWEMSTPYGATEALPVCTISAKEVLEETAELTAGGAGTCVGRPFRDVEVRVIRPQDGPIESLDQTEACTVKEIGEIIVSSASATRQYFRRDDATKQAKIQDEGRFWHRMGDMGYFDSDNRLWFCGRKAHIVQTENGPLYPVRCEPIFNLHPHVYRSALVGVGAKGNQQPVLVVEPEPGKFPSSTKQTEKLFKELLELGSQNPLSVSIQKFLLHKSLPVDKRHNVKIDREGLAQFATAQLNK